jgi:hypothetical protein
MSSPGAAERVAAERWFLRHGLPSVLTRRARWRQLWQRSAPALAGFATVSLASLIVAVATGFRSVDIDLEPTSAEWVVLAGSLSRLSELSAPGGCGASQRYASISSISSAHCSEVSSWVRACFSVARSGFLARKAVKTLSI